MYFLFSYIQYELSVGDKELSPFFAKAQEINSMSCVKGSTVSTNAGRTFYQVWCNPENTLQNAVKKRKPSGNLMLHTDRGVEYRGHIYQKALKRHGIIYSLSRAGKCTDNAHMESKSDKELRGTLGSYINKYYNVLRMHSGINYCSPIEYEALAA